MDNLSDLLAYIITKLVDMDCAFGKTKLVKLLYLIDVETYKVKSRTFSGINWIFYHYGPYAFEIDEALKQLEIDIPQENVKTYSGFNAKIFKPYKSLTSNFEESTGFQKMLVDRVLETWGPEDLNTLLSYVYFHTEPMENAVRNAKLDFSTIQRPSREMNRIIVTKEDVIKSGWNGRDKFIKAMEKHVNSTNLYPKPRFDAIFLNGLSNMDIEDTFPLITGEVEIDEETKKEIHHGSA